MAFRKNYLPAQAQPWARELQDRIEALERLQTSSEINNRTRDDQLQSSYNRLDAAFGQLASQQSTLSAQQTTLTNTVATLDSTVTTLNNTVNTLTTTTATANTAATNANNAINRIGTHTTQYVPYGVEVAFNNNSGNILPRSFSYSLSTLGGGSRAISAIAFCSVDAGVNSPGAVDNTPHRLVARATISIGTGSPPPTGESSTFIGVRKGFTDSELGVTDSRVAVYGGGALVPSVSRTYSSSTNVTISVTISIDASEISGAAYFGTVRLEGVLVNVSDA
jgi:outer membrane murein-binding lipoprotein Lpp